MTSHFTAGWTASSGQCAESEFDQAVEDGLHARISMCACSMPESSGSSKSADGSVARDWNSFLSLDRRHGQVDVCELFGGDGITTQLCARYYELRSGFNFELRQGFDLLNPQHEQYLFEYLKACKPIVVVMAPPCKSFGPWARLNRVIHPELFQKSRKDGECLGRICANVARLQLEQGRHFVCEQPQSSEMFDMQCWRGLRDSIHVCRFDQCRTGLREREGRRLPLMKPTQMWASSPLLTHALDGLRCRRNHEHGKVKSAAERWTTDLCKRLAVGVADTVDEWRELCGLHYATYNCPGCRGHVRREDPRHTHGDDCRFRGEDSVTWSCPGCVKHRHRDDASHTLDPNCRWSIARSVSAGAGRARAGRHPRDPSVPAADDPTSRLRLADAPPVGVPADNGGRSEADRIRADKAARSDDFERQVIAQDRRVEQAAQSVRGDSSNAAASAGPRRRFQDAEVQAEAAVRAVERADAAPEERDGAGWSRFDLGAALQQLRSVRPGIARRALRKLHIRWYHCGAKRMKMLLEAAGVEPSVLALTDDVVATCGTCRLWTRPGVRSVTSTRLSTQFNESVQVDLLFVKHYTILHMIDSCIRWSAAQVIPSREFDAIMTGMELIWFRQYGFPQELVSDREGALDTDAAAGELEKRHVKLTLRARYQHAGIVERHNELLRRQIHYIDAQATADGVRTDFPGILAEALFAKNALFTCGGFSPYEALFGRTPGLLNVQIAVQSMIQATAEERARRADTHKSRRAGELLDLQVGDLVEFYRKASSKDVVSWLGPAVVTDLVSLKVGVIGIRWQSRLLTCRVQDVRRAMTYFQLHDHVQQESPVHVLRQAAEDHNGFAVRVGWFQRQNEWISFEANARHGKTLLAGLHVAACCLGLNGVVNFRFGAEIEALPPINSDDTLVLWWKRGDICQWYTSFLIGNHHINLGRLTGCHCSEVALVQFVMTDTAGVQSVRRCFPFVQNLGGIYDPYAPKVQAVEFDDDETRPTISSQTQFNPDNQRRTRGPKMITNSDTRATAVNPVATSDVSDAEHGDGQDATAAASIALVVESMTDWLQYSVQECNMASCSESRWQEPACNLDCIVLEQMDLHQELLEPAELVFDFRRSQYLTSKQRPLEPDEELVMMYEAGSEVKAVIQRVNNVLTHAEALENAEKCRSAMILELQRWNKHKAWVRSPRKLARNLLQSRWVLKWKEINKQRQVKGRLVVQGFRDRQEVSNFAGTTSRWGQRAVLIIATQYNWPLVSADVSEAFLRGLSFEELASEDGSKPLREVQLLLPPGAAELLRSLDGMSDFDERSECLRMLKPGFGLKDAPRLWNLALQRVLRLIGLGSTKADRQLFVKHDSNKQLVLVLSVHVDDIKMAGVEAEIAATIKVLEEHFDALKLERNNFEHLGLRRELHPDGSRTVSQIHYVAELRLIPEGDLRLNLETRVSDEVQRLYMSLLGGIAWTVQTRCDIAVFVSALQRKLKAPTGRDVVNLNKLVQYVKDNPLKLRYTRVAAPWRLIAISDSSYRGDDNDCLAMRSGLICLASKNGIEKGFNTLQMLEFVSKKQSRVCRSTYAAELYSCLDLTGLAATINLAFTEILEGISSAAVLAERQDSGKMSLRLDCVIDARAVLDSVTADEIRTPNDKIMLIHALRLRELLDSKQLDQLIWCDTRDMLADGLNKGSVSRVELQRLCSEGVWEICHDLICRRTRGVTALTKSGDRD